MQILYHIFCPVTRNCAKRKVCILGRIIDSKDKNLIGDNVKRLRIEQKLSQQLLSNKLETVGVYICRGSISRIEDKSRTVTDIELYGLSQILGVSITELFSCEYLSNIS